MEKYKLEVRPAWSLLPGTRVLSDGVIFAFVFRSCKECGLILCNLKDKESVRIAFTDEMRFGDLYSCKISGIVPAEWGYRYYMDGISFIDPDIRRLLTLSDGQLAGGIYPDSEEYLTPSPEAGQPVNFASQWIYVCNVRAFTSSRTSKVKHKGTFAGIVEKNRALMTEKLLADEIAKDATFANAKEWKVNDETVTISVEKV